MSDAAAHPTYPTYPPLVDDERSRRFAVRYDDSYARAERSFLGALRRTLIGELTGRVVEIGAGTGANVPYYLAAYRLGGIESVDLVEPLPSMRHLLALRVAHVAHGSGGPPLRVLDARAERLPHADASVAAVVATMVLCSVGDVAATLAEVRRVLRPGGTLAFCEHTRSPGPKRLLQQAMTPLAVRHAAGCHYDRDIPALLAAAGFARIDQVPVGAPWTYRMLPEWPFVAGVATTS